MVLGAGGHELECLADGLRRERSAFRCLGRSARDSVARSCSRCALTRWLLQELLHRWLGQRSRGRGSWKSSPGFVPLLRLLAPRAPLRARTAMGGRTLLQKPPTPPSTRLVPRILRARPFASLVPPTPFLSSSQLKESLARLSRSPASLLRPPWTCTVCSQTASPIPSFSCVAQRAHRSSVLLNADIEPLGKRQRITDELVRFAATIRLLSRLPHSILLTLSPCTQVNAYGGEDAVRKMLKLALDQFSRTILDWDLPYTQVNELRIVPGFNTGAPRPLRLEDSVVPNTDLAVTHTQLRSRFTWTARQFHSTFTARPGRPIAGY